MPWEIAAELLQVNVAAAVHLTSLFMPEMIQRRRGHVVNVGSIAGGIPSQGIVMYAASLSSTIDMTN